MLALSAVLLYASAAQPPPRPRMVATHSLYNLTVPRGAMSAAQLGASSVAFAGGVSHRTPHDH